MESKTTATEISRREMLSLALSLPFAAVKPNLGRASRRANQLGLQTFVNAPSSVVPVGDSSVVKQIELTRQWQGSLCRTHLVNRGREAARLKEVVLFDLALALPAETRLYGEGFQMLSQTGGTVSKPIDLGNYTDAKHYKLTVPHGARSFFSMMTLALPDGGNYLLVFTSCHRFTCQFYLRDSSLQVVCNTEGLEIKPGERWELEEFTFRSGANRGRLLAELAERLTANHPPLHSKLPPAGWCSWYCFGPRVTSQQVLDNLEFIARDSPGLRYIQIDDGYQPAMGDWLETGAAFGGNVQGVLKEIRKRGFEPAIWVAPFSAEEKSHLFEQHVDWFVKDTGGKPLRSDQVTFGGWRH